MERKIGEIFEQDDIKLIVVKEQSNKPCVGCFYLHRKMDCLRDFSLCGLCTREFRTDKTDVHFEKIEP